MNRPENRLFNRLEPFSSQEKEQQRFRILKQLDLLKSEAIPIFDEATQMAARFLEVPISILGIMIGNQICLKSSVGLSELGLMNELAQKRQIARQDSFCAHLIDSEQVLKVEDALRDPVFRDLGLVKNYGIQAYLGMPLLTTTGCCIGSLAVMDTKPRSFSSKEQEFLAVTARWCMREFESNYFYRFSSPVNGLELINDSHEDLKTSLNDELDLSKLHDYQIQLLEKLIEKIRAPLTSIIGMSSVLKTEAYGHLTEKQKKYLEIVYGSGQQIGNLLDAIVDLGVLKHKLSQLTLAPVSVEMLLNQVIFSLDNFSNFEISSSPTTGLHLLDREKFKQTIYYLIVGLMDLSNHNNPISIQVYYNQHINIAIKNHEVATCCPNYDNKEELTTKEPWLKQFQTSIFPWETETLQTALIAKALQQTEPLNYSYSQLLALFFSCYLAEIQKGKILVQSCPDWGYRYILKLPRMMAAE